MWGECGHEMLRGQSCCRIWGAGAQQLGVLQGWSEQESSRDAALGRYREVFLLGGVKGEGLGGRGKVGCSVLGQEMVVLVRNVRGGKSPKV